MITAEQARAKMALIEQNKKELEDIEKKINSALMTGYYWCDVRKENLCDTNIEVLRSLGYDVEEKRGDSYDPNRQKCYTICWRE